MLLLFNENKKKFYIVLYNEENDEKQPVQKMITYTFAFIIFLATINPNFVSDNHCKT